MTITESEIIREKIFSSGLTIEIRIGDITRIHCDVIVNAANEHLAHGGGVAAAIVRRGGQIIQSESQDWVAKHGPISHEKPAFTSAGKLSSKFIIHAVGPRWGEGNEEIKLAQTIRSSLYLANDLKAKSICFPAISTGIFGFPVKQAAKVILKEFASYEFQYYEHALSINTIILILFNQESLNAFEKSFDVIFNERQEQ